MGPLHDQWVQCGKDNPDCAIGLPFPNSGRHGEGANKPSRQIGHKPSWIDSEGRKRKPTSTIRMMHELYPGGYDAPPMEYDPELG